MGDPPMTDDGIGRGPEASENYIRNLLAQLRESDPEAMQRIVADVFINGLGDHQTAVIQKTDDEGIRYGIAVVVRGINESVQFTRLCTTFLRDTGAIGDEEEV